MRLLIVLAIATAVSGCAGAYVAGDLGARDRGARHLSPPGGESR